LSKGIADDGIAEPTVKSASAEMKANLSKMKLEMNKSGRMAYTMSDEL